MKKKKEEVNINYYAFYLYNLRFLFILITISYIDNQGVMSKSRKSWRGKRGN